ncbi:IclR family transcriptional regulator [Actinacidiphila yeochonensis]|uniref:IclR family transcriptional regulator n=1 Tax=Actinacidiphila yeochonensis TaxID=89050 RepID=UPI00068BFA1B|nr:helix-turn-helix domain-containing protein [Actinacidiphila yeochonensis]
MAATGIERIVAVVDAVAAGAVRLDDVRSATGIPYSSAHRIVGRLVAQGVLHRGADGSLAVGLRVRAWGAVPSSAPDAHANQRALHEIRDLTGESVQLYRRLDGHCVCVASAESRHGLRDTVLAGTAFPLTATAAGKVLLAWSPPASDLQGADERQLRAIRADGWCVSPQEGEPGVLGVAVPVPGPGRAAVPGPGAVPGPVPGPAAVPVADPVAGSAWSATAALAVSGPATRLRPHLARIRSTLLDNADRF